MSQGTYILIIEDDKGIREILGGGAAPGQSTAAIWRVLLQRDTPLRGRIIRMSSCLISACRMGMAWS